MLEHLDDIDWSQVNHAYGAASDVPAMIRALAADDAGTRAEAFHAAYGNIFHQGTRYSATPKAIPFLVELASQPQPKQLGELLGLIVHCVAGYFSPIGGPYNASGTVWGHVTSPMSDYGETTEILGACEQAAERAVPLCLKLLAHGDASVRARALHLLAALRQFADRYEVVPRLRSHNESDPSVRAMIAFALAHLLPMSESNVLDTIARDDADDLVRLLATMGGVRRGTAKNAAELLTWLSDEELGERYTSLPFHADDLAGHIGSLLTLLGPDVLREALPGLVEQLRTASDFGVVGILEAALAAVFGDHPIPAPADLTADQRNVLETLVHNQPFWMIGNALSVLMERDLPSMREEMAKFLGVDIEDDPIEAARISARMMAPFGEVATLEAWHKVLDLEPGDPEALVNIGIIATDSDHHEQAIELLENALASSDALDPALAGRGWFSLGLAHHQTDDNEQALAAFERAQQLLRGDARDQARQNRVAILQTLGRAAEALALREEAGAQTTDELYHLGLAQVKAGRYPECIASISRVLAAEPDHALAHYTIACAYALSGDADNALASVARAVEIEPALKPDIAGDSDFASLASDVRFKKLVS